MGTVLVVLELAVVIGAIVMGVRMGGMGLGIWGAAGVAVLVFVFHLSPGTTPGSAMLIILAVITAASAMQAAGGIDFLVKIAAGIIRKNPKQITLIAPLVSYAFTVGAGTSNIFFPLIPVIYEVSYDNGIRPERPLSLSVIATGLGITSSPVSAAMAAMLGLLAVKGISVSQILLITVPSSFVAIVVGSLVMNRYGRDLKDDPEYQRRLAEGKVQPPKKFEGAENVEPELPKGASLSAFIFLGGVVAVILLGAIPGAQGLLLPKGADMTVAIQLVMFIVALLILLFCSAKVGDVLKQPVFSSGITAIVALFGIAWLANTFIAAYEEQIVKILGGAVAALPILFAFAIFIFAALTTSQSATTNTIIPIGLALPGLGVGAIIAMWQALAGVYFLPANGNQLACVETDLTGSTKIGKLVLNHSFMVPLLVCTVTSVAVGLAIQSLLHF
ncbi:MAG: anaerobic C4-dicarboxylate transporter family protein [Coriobacteriia bacterium]|nr:anaerobic C4-dicarboxylate transporter family protein [Coriobacteriia bacterium]